MNEAAARQVTLVEAYESAQPASPSWSEDDRAWADRVAIEATGVAAAPDDFMAQRAGHAMQRLAPREPAAARWLARPLWRNQWGAVVAVVAFVLGLLADSVGSSQRVNLLAPPLWGHAKPVSVTLCKLAAAWPSTLTFFDGQERAPALSRRALLGRSGSLRRR